MFNKQLNERVRELEDSVRDLVLRTAKGDAVRDLLEDQVEKLMDQLSVKSDTLSDLVEAHASLLERYREQAAALEKAREVQPVPSWTANVPLHVSEDEEEAKWQLENGLIDDKMFNEILEQAGLEPRIEVQFG